MLLLCSISIGITLLNLARSVGANLQISGIIACPSDKKAKAVDLLMYTNNSDEEFLGHAVTGSVGEFEIASKTEVDISDLVTLYALFDCRKNHHIECLTTAYKSVLCAKEYNFIVQTVDFDLIQETPSTNIDIKDFLDDSLRVYYAKATKSTEITPKILVPSEAVVGHWNSAQKFYFNRVFTKFG